MGNSKLLMHLSKPMEKIISYLGEPDFFENKRHIWQFGNYLLSISPYSKKTGFFYRFNILDSNGVSCGGGGFTNPDKVLEISSNLNHELRREKE